MARPVVVLPQPLSPTSPSVSPRLHAQADAVDSAHRSLHPPQQPRADREMHLQVADLEEREAVRRLVGGGAGRCGQGGRAHRRGELLGEVAGRPVRRAFAAHRPQLRRGGAADCPARRQSAARMERAAAGHVGRRRRLAGNGIEPVARHIDARRAAEQGRRVGMARMGEDVADRPGLDDAPAIHHRHAVRDLGDDAEIVRDQHDGGARLPLAPGQERQHLRLHGHVERGGGLVRDDDLGTPRHRHGDDSALAHPARELERVLERAIARVGDLHFAQQVHGPDLALVAASGGHARSRLRRSAGRQAGAG